jgi:quinolinate synthase
MRLHTLEKIRNALRDLEPRLEMAEDLRVAALHPLERMMALG